MLRKLAELVIHDWFPWLSIVRNGYTYNEPCRAYDNILGPIVLSFTLTKYGADWWPTNRFVKICVVQSRYKPFAKKWEQMCILFGYCSQYFTLFSLNNLREITDNLMSDKRETFGILKLFFSRLYNMYIKPGISGDL